MTCCSPAERARRRAPDTAEAEKPREPATHEQLAMCVVSSRAWWRPGSTAPASRTASRAALRKECGGPAAAAATAVQLAKRIDLLRDWATHNTP